MTRTAHDPVEEEIHRARRAILTTPELHLDGDLFAQSLCSPSDPVSSKEAAGKVQSGSAKLRGLVLAYVVRRGPMAAAQCSNDRNHWGPLGYSENNVRCRFSELTRAKHGGLLVATGQRNEFGMVFDDFARVDREKERVA